MPLKIKKKIKERKKKGKDLSNKLVASYNKEVSFQPMASSR